MPAIVDKVINNSIAEELEIGRGDEILSIDGIKLSDMIDYNFYCKAELLTLEVKKKDGETENKEASEKSETSENGTEEKKSEEGNSEQK